MVYICAFQGKVGYENCDYRARLHQAKLEPNGLQPDLIFAETACGHHHRQSHKPDALPTRLTMEASKLMKKEVRRGTTPSQIKKLLSDKSKDTVVLK